MTVRRRAARRADNTSRHLSADEIADISATLEQKAHAIFTEYYFNVTTIQRASKSLVILIRATPCAKMRDAPRTDATRIRHSWWCRRRAIASPSLSDYR